MIRLESVAVGRGSRVIADNLSFAVSRGEMTALWGPSGVGKSTILASLAGALPILSGEVWFDGTSVSAKQLRDKIRQGMTGICLSSHNLVPYLTLRQNFLLAGVRDASSQTLKRLAIEATEDSLPAELSTGMQRRAAVVASMVGRPDLVLVDEPTAHLDSDNTALVVDLLMSYRDEGHALIVATHDERVADRCQAVVSVGVAR